MNDERNSFIEKAKADAAETRAAIEQEFAERQARVDAGWKTPEIKRRDATEIPRVIYKDRENALVRTDDDAWNEWCDARISRKFSEVYIDEIVRYTVDCVERPLEAKITALSAEVKTLRGMLEKRKRK
jgi:hypothetical protein